MSRQPNVLLMLSDDMGFSDIGCYGGEIHTPNLDALAAGGLKYTQFYNTARCCPSRASLLTGLYPQQADIGHMTGDDEVDGYLGDLSLESATIAEALKAGGYSTYLSGKWHVTGHLDGPRHNWPCQRGFDDFYGILTGAANYYQPRTLMRNNEPIEPEGDDYFLTDAIGSEAVRQIRQHVEARPGQPFFQYVAFTAPHWPLHAHSEDIERYQGRFDAGWDRLREERYARMVQLGLIDPRWPLTERDPRVCAWDQAGFKEWQARRMEVYAAQVDRMDQNVGRIMETLRATEQWENTLIFFLSDNGGCAEELGPNMGAWATDHARVGIQMTRDHWEVRYGNVPAVLPGDENTYQSCGIPWANVQNTPFRLYKHWVHEGGIATPLIAHWPSGIAARGEWRQQPAQLPDIMATFLDVAGVPYPATCGSRRVQPLEGFSMIPTFTDRPHGRDVLYWEHEGHRAVRKGRWKLVCKYPGTWELYDMEADRTETTNLIDRHPALAADLAALHDQWARRCGVLPWAELEERRKSMG